MSAAVSLPSSILDLPDGLHEGIPEALYHQRIPGVASKSALDLIARAPACYATWLTGADRKETDALAFGKAFHCALLEPDVYGARYVVRPDFGDCRKTDNKKRRDEWLAANTGKHPIEHDDAKAIVGMVRSIRSHHRASKLIDLDDGASEITLRWVDEETGLICKGRGDHYIERLGLCVDVKTCEDARREAFERSVENYGYHNQNAFYDEGFRALGASLDRFVFLAVEKHAPYLLNVFNLEDDWVAAGREWTRRNLDELARCVELGDYSRGYDTAIQTLSRPAWARKKTS